MLKNVMKVNKPQWNYPPVLTQDFFIHIIEGQNP